MLLGAEECGLRRRSAWMHRVNWCDSAWRYGADGLSPGKMVIVEVTFSAVMRALVITPRSPTITTVLQGEGVVGEGSQCSVAAGHCTNCGTRG